MEARAEDVEARELGLRPDGLGEVTRQSLCTGLFALACTAAAAMAMAHRIAPETDLALATGIVAAAAAMALALDLRRRRRVWSDFRLRIGDDSISTTPAGRRPRSLGRDEVRHVVQVEWPAPGLVVRGPPGRAPVFVPAALHDFGQVRDRLASWRPVETSRVPRRLARAWLVTIPGAVLLESLAIGSRDARLAGPASGVLAFVALWSLSNVLRSHRLGLRAKSLSLLLLVPAAWLVWHAWEVSR